MKSLYVDSFLDLGVFYQVFVIWTAFLVNVVAIYQRVQFKFVASTIFFSEGFSTTKNIDYLLLLVSLLHLLRCIAGASGTNVNTHLLHVQTRITWNRV